MTDTAFRVDIQIYKSGAVWVSSNTANTFLTPEQFDLYVDTLAKIATILRDVQPAETKEKTGETAG